MPQRININTINRIVGEAHDFRFLADSPHATHLILESFSGCITTDTLVSADIEDLSEQVKRLKTTFEPDVIVIDDTDDSKKSTAGKDDKDNDVCSSSSSSVEVLDPKKATKLTTAKVKKEKTMPKKVHSNDNVVVIDGVSADAAVKVSHSSKKTEPEKIAATATTASSRVKTRNMLKTATGGSVSADQLICSAPKPRKTKATKKNLTVDAVGKSTKPKPLKPLPVAAKRFDNYIEDVELSQQQEWKEEWH